MAARFLPVPDAAELRALEESLWRPETRFDEAHVEDVLAVDGDEPQAAHRSSGWVLDGDRWRLRFDQGTPAA
ncbi:MAG: hypothetical protein M3Q27_03265 [Actinomycetota bacterium]|nr:hypothetical protein [Actinomycetota bacterium]